MIPDPSHSPKAGGQLQMTSSTPQGSSGALELILPYSTEFKGDYIPTALSSAASGNGSISFPPAAAVYEPWSDTRYFPTLASFPQPTLPLKKPALPPPYFYPPFDANQPTPVPYAYAQSHTQPPHPHRFTNPADYIPAFKPSNFVSMSQGKFRRNADFSLPDVMSPADMMAGMTPARRTTNLNVSRTKVQGVDGLYEATYSSTSVWEFETPNGITVMRRKSDSWVNATHILKVAGVEKVRRAKNMVYFYEEGEHEKIQGGYGRYQGTWVPLYMAKIMAERYKIHAVLASLLDIPE